jgi:hypothetical protein
MQDKADDMLFQQRCERLCVKVHSRHLLPELAVSKTEYAVPGPAWLWL